MLKTDRWSIPIFPSTPLISTTIASLSLWGLLAFPSSADEPIYQSLVSKGLQVADSKFIPLTPPSLRDGMPADEQKATVEKLAGEIGMERFMKDSAVSPFVLEIKSVEKLPNDGKGKGDAEVQRIDIWFVAYGTIDAILDKKLFEDLAVPNKPTGDGPSDASRELTPEEIRKYQLKVGELPDGSRASYGHLGFSLFDKVRLSVVTHAQSIRSAESLSLVSRIHEGFPELPCTWSPMTVSSDEKVQLGTPEPYSSGASYAKVTQLQFEPKALLIEMHVLFVEPQGWFNGRNMLRSKLPPVVQDGLRKFRRKLAQ